MLLNTFTLHFAFIYVDKKNSNLLAVKSVVLNLRKRSPETKFIFSIGGFDSPDEQFSKLVSNGTSRNKFIQHTVDFLNSNSFDGLDLFWYSPVYWNNNDHDHHDDKPNFLQFVKELKAIFEPKKLLLTTEVSALTYILDVAFNLTEVSNYVDYINMYSWDLTGYWSNKTGYGNPIQKYGTGCHYLVNMCKFSS